MMKFLKFSIIFMTTGIVVLGGLIIYKSFFEKTQTSSSTMRSADVIYLNLPEQKAVRSVSHSDASLSVLTQDNQILIFDRANGTLQQRFILQMPLE